MGRGGILRRPRRLGRDSIKSVRYSPKLVLLAPALALLAAVAVMPDLAQLKKMSARFAPVDLKHDESGLSAGDRKALPKLIEAARVMDSLSWTSSGWATARCTRSCKRMPAPLGQERLQLFPAQQRAVVRSGRARAFIPGVPERKPAGANFYPEDMTRQEFEAWVKTLPAAEQEQAEGFFTVIRRGRRRQARLRPVQPGVRRRSGARLPACCAKPPASPTTRR